jgi:snurportin-1
MAGTTTLVPPGRHHKRTVSDQQKRRELALQRQKQGCLDLQHQARQLALSAPNEEAIDAYGEQPEELVENVAGSASENAVFDYSERDEEEVGMEDAESNPGSKPKALLEGTRLKGLRAREFFSRQLMLPEWMVDIPPYLKKDWFIMPRVEGQRCVVISANGVTLSRQRNGRILHSFPSVLSNGARTKEVVAGSHVYCVLDCIFHAPDKTYYVIDLMCWRGYFVFDCRVEFRFFWMKTKLTETGALCAPSAHHHYRFSVVPVYECNVPSLQEVYSGPVPFERDGILFYNRHALYKPGVTLLVLVWKDAQCSQYLLDTDSHGNVPAYQQVVLELNSDGSVVTSDDPPVILGTLAPEFLQQNAQHVKLGMLLRFAIGDQGLSLVEGKPVVADIHFQGVANKNRARRANTCTKILFQYAARHGALTVHDLLAAIEASDEEGDTSMG